ncbi:MAG: glycosyltransferase family 4 protein [Deferribacteres bacterium]|nr:glycosyltransferase family 4 protein [candidate division KSB1 bacterium]MCB9501464.1 glycosyltransferase family 4 protein [Deferribacteres bacterium]
MNTSSKNSQQKKRVFFISKYATWQDYRNEILTFIGDKYDAEVEILTTGTLRSYIRGNDVVQYKIFRSWLPVAAEKIGFFPGAVKYIIKEKPDVVLAQNDTLQFTEYLAFLVCKIFGIRFVWWTHAHMPSVVYRSKFKKWLRQKYALFFLKKSDAVVTYCRVGEQYLVENYVERTRVICAPNTLNTDKLLKLATLTRQKFSKQELRKSAGLPLDRNYILFMGRLTTRKRVEKAIQIIGHLNKSESTKYHLIIIGDGNNRENLQNLALQIAPDFVTFTGAIFDDELKARYFIMADLFIIPGAVGLAIVYSFCFGLPIITTADANHGPEIIYLKNGKNGVMVEGNSIINMAEMIEELFADTLQIKAMSAAAEQTIREEAPVQLMAERMAQALAL